MGQVTVSVNGRDYQIACDDGQETHLKKLAQYLDQRIDELVAAVGQPGESRLLLMASLLVVDELWDAFREIDRLRNADGAAATRVAAEEALAGAIESMAERIERIAHSLEQA